MYTQNPPENNPKTLIEILKHHELPNDIITTIQTENLLSLRLLNRLNTSFPQYSKIHPKIKPIFLNNKQFAGISGFRTIVQTLKGNGVTIKDIEERELFIKIYRFLATGHILNQINWSQFETDPNFHLVFPQPGMIKKEIVTAYLSATSKEKRQQIIDDYHDQTNPHDGKQLLNKPWFINVENRLEVLDGSQHKYPQTQLILDQQTQHCYAFCTYCFRHAQVRHDEDMFLQKDINQVHRYLRKHPEVTDLLITGGDAGYLSTKRLWQYVEPFLTDPDLTHIKTLRLGTRLLTYQPELVLKPNYQEKLDIFDKLYQDGIQVAWMAHFSTPHELLNPLTIAAIRRLQAHGVRIRSQSPIIKHVSMYVNQNNEIDIEKSAQNWIDLATIIGVLGIGFHSMYCPRPTGEYHYFTTPLSTIDKIFSKIYRSLPSINRPSRYISMTISAGKVSILGTTTVGGKTAFALKFTESRNMEWMDKVFLAHYDETANDITLLKPLDGDQFFFEDELKKIEEDLEKVLGEGE